MALLPQPLQMAKVPYLELLVHQAAAVAVLVMEVLVPMAVQAAVVQHIMVLLPVLQQQAKDFQVELVMATL
jgi:hypothetical protein